MGCSLFRFSSGTCEPEPKEGVLQKIGKWWNCPTQNNERPVLDKAPNNEAYCQVMASLTEGNYTLVMLLYPFIPKFNGLKIAVYANEAWQQIQDKTHVDPHFYDDAISPLARFQPTPMGLAGAIQAYFPNSVQTGALWATLRNIEAIIQKGLTEAQKL